MEEKKFRQVCHCEKCGSEAEMIVTCEFVPQEAEEKAGKKEARVSEEKSPGAMPGHAVCTNCGAEADMWVDFKE
ncbi:MAG: hypothetical protein ACOC1H_01390 [Desulfosalsimonas sp.]